MLTFLFPVSDICLELLRKDETSQNRAGVSVSYLQESAKIIQKEEMWRKSISSKRELALSPDDERNTRQRCSSTGQGFSEVFSMSDQA